jgi:hypothetical protein
MALATDDSASVRVDWSYVDGPNTYRPLTVVSGADDSAGSLRAGEETVTRTPHILLARRRGSNGSGLPAVGALDHPALCAWSHVNDMLTHTALDK